MRESIGGTMLFWIVLFFMSIFISFMAFVIKYARVYKIKNSMISYIERQEGIDSDTEFETQLLNYGYNGSYRLCLTHPNETGGYYSLELYMTLDFPILNSVTPVSVSIKGETRTIETGVHINEKQNWSCLENDGCCVK